MTLQEVQDIFSSLFCDRKVHLAGLVEFTKSRVSQEMVNVIRKVGQTNNFTPVTYAGGVLVFYTVDPFIVESSYSKIPLIITVLSDDYNDYKKIIEALNECEPIEVSLDSQGIYNKYFVEDDNKPFQNYASEYKITIIDSFKLCCEEWGC